MQSATTAGNENETTLVTAKALREMTITQEGLFESRKANVLETLMSSMVRIASENGGTDYVANLNPQFPKAILDAVVAELTALGYTLTIAEVTDPNPGVGTFTALTIAW